MQQQLKIMRTYWNLTAFACLTALFSIPAGAQFAPPQYIHQDGTAPVSDYVYLDWNGDGRTDRCYSDDIHFFWQAGNGAGSFGSPQAFEAINGKFLTGDIDGDGFPDLVFGRTNSNLIYWRKNNEGQPGALNVIFQGKNYAMLWLQDMDYDGDLDLPFYSIYDDKIRWVENSGLGYFIQTHFSLQLDVHYALHHFEFTDLDGDGRLDALVSLYYNTGSTYWQKGLPDGSFADPVYLEWNLPYVSSNMWPLDIDGDGDTDILHNASGLSDMVIYWFPNLGNGQFGPKTQLLTSNQQLLFFPSDFDNDGDPDLMTRQTDPSDGLEKVAWFRNEGGGQFSFLFTNALTYGLPFVAPDLTGDGLKDIAFSIGSANVALNLGNGMFNPVPAILKPATGTQFVFPADVDGDGYMDVCFGSNSTDFFGWFPNDGTGQFGPPVQFTSFQDPDFFAFADLNNDGIGDFLCNSFYDSALVFWMGLGGGQFAPPDTSKMDFTTFSGFMLADGDDDGYLDVLPPLNPYYPYDPPIYWYKNDGTGGFIPEPDNVTPSYDDGSDCFADFDGDGLRDIVYASYLQGILYWHKNLGGGQYGAGNIITGFDNYKETFACARDMDGDGDADVVLQVDRKVLTWYENRLPDGNPNWGIHFIYANTTTDTYQPLLADFDLDGDLDVLRLNGYSLANMPPLYPVDYFLNDGSGEVTYDTLPFAIPGGAQQSFSVDMDADGDPDVLFMRQGVIGWLENFANAPAIEAICFFDENANGKFDSTESFLPNVALQLEPGAAISFTDGNGLFRYYADPGAYTLTFLPDSCLQLTTDSAVYHIQAANPGAPRLFGFAPESGKANITAALVSAPARCNFVVPFWATLRNQGCSPAPARLSLKLDPLIAYIDAEPAPVFAQADSLVWITADSLLPGETRTIRLELKMPGTDHLGDTVHIQGWAQTLGGTPNSLLFATQINCAYDPNDKRVNRETVDYGYDPAEAELIYTIRFQNTGTDTAFTVVLRDTLSADLDWSGFRPLAASHSFRAVLDGATGELIFIFENILLPDSNTNKVASHGFVQFAIRLQTGLPLGTVVSNRASIYFDFNPAVPTNAIETVVQRSVLANGERSRFLPVEIAPNPNNGVFMVRLPAPAPSDMIFRITDLTGRFILEVAANAGNERLEIQAEQMPAGLYFVQAWQDSGVIGTARFIKL